MNRNLILTESREKNPIEMVEKNDENEKRS